MKDNPVVLVSLGPGDAELITLKGYHALQEANVILCPGTKLKNGEVSSRAADILHELGALNGKIALFAIPMSKDRKKALHIYDKMSEVAMESHKLGAKVAVVTEGDAGFYSSMHYVYDKLHHAGIPVTCIPGIPAFIASGALGGLHIVQQEERLMVIPGNPKIEELSRLVELEVTVVIMKLSQCVDEVHQFINQNPAYHYHYFENVGTENEYYLYNTDELLKKEFPYFSLMIIRKN